MHHRFTGHSAMIPPSPALAGCVRGYLVRNTLEADLTPAERCNHFPATPTCVLTWVLEGHDTRVQQIPASRHALRVPMVFGGPHTMPSTSCNAGPVRFFTLMLYPDALHAVTGLDIAAHLNRYSALVDVLGRDWQAMAHAVFHADDDAQRVQLIEAFLLPRWPAFAPAAAAGPMPFHDWSLAMARRAAAVGGGHSQRQIDRRINAWTGQSMRQLRAMARAEASLLRTQAALASQALNWSDIAYRSGFSDQSHLCREFRQRLGLSPSELKQGLLGQAHHWVCQVWQ